MRKLTVPAMLLIATATAATLTAAVWLGGRPLPAAAADDLRSTITVVGDGRVTVQPDVAHVGFGVEATAPTYADAQSQASARMQAVIDTLVGLGVPRDDIRTSRLSVNPVYNQDDRTTIRGYQANNSVQVTLRDLNRVGEVVEAATAAGANRVEGVSFAVENIEPPKMQARELAMQNARAKADHLASLAGLRVVGIKAISESDASSTPRAAAAPARSDGAYTPPVEPGTQEVRTQVTVTYIVE